MKIINPKNGQAFESKYDSHITAHGSLLARLTAEEFNDPKFPQSIYDATRQFKGKQLGSPSQLFWLHKLANEGGKPVQKPLKKIDMSGLVDMLATAKESGLKNPALVLMTDKGLEVRVAMAGPKSRYPGAVMVSSSAFRGPYYGRIDAEGDFYPGRDYIADVGALLNDMSKDPVAAAAAQGHMTGRCCFCRKALEDDKSTTLGYGPVCARKFGLAYSKTAASMKRSGQMSLPLTKRHSTKPTVEEEKPKAKVRRIIRRVIDQA